MKTIATVTTCLMVWFLLMTPAVCEQLQPLKLPAPQTNEGRSLMQVLKDRHTTREFSKKPLSSQTLSNLLWAAFGINRPDAEKRTAPSAHNWQEIDIYVATGDGLYLYDPAVNVLIPVVSKDIRPLTGGQDFVAEAPVNLIYVADFSKMDGSREDKTFYSAADTGFIAENVYLFCASKGLGTVVRGWVNRPELSRAMGLRPEQVITLAQTVGYPE